MDWFYKLQKKERYIVTAFAWTPLVIVLLSPISSAPSIFLTGAIGLVFTVASADANAKEEKAEKERQEIALRSDGFDVLIRSMTPDEIEVEHRKISTRLDEISFLTDHYGKTFSQKDCEAYLQELALLQVHLSVIEEELRLREKGTKRQFDETGEETIEGERREEEKKKQP